MTHTSGKMSNNALAATSKDMYKIALHYFIQELEVI